MDEKSLQLLEFPAVRHIIAGYTSFAVGREKALGLEPLTDHGRISALLEQSAEARRLLALDAAPSIGGAADIREVVRMAALGKMLEPANLIEVQHTLAILRQARQGLKDRQEEAPLLAGISGRITEISDLEKDIGRCISRGGEVLDRASPRLASVRKRLIETRQQLHSRLEEIIRAPRWEKIIQEPLITERDGRYVIPVKTEFRREMEGISHDVSNTGATVFVEPWVAVDLGNALRELAAEEKHEVERILQELSARVGSYDKEISAGLSALGELDVIFAKARYAREAKAVEPNMINFHGGEGSGFVRLVQARHPLLGGKAVPLDLEIGRDYSVLVITGPNTGGKTVALKTIGLMSLMAQAGIPVPAAPETCLPVFDGVFADIGDEQSIEQTLSSFSWHISNMVRILKATSPRSLVLLDELGASTDPAEGSALARAVLLHFLALGTLTAATTHYADLKAFAHNTPGIQNASFDFDPANLKPTYHLTLGIPGGSNALATAERLGIPPEIVEQARGLLSRGALDLDAALEDIMVEKQKTIDIRETLEQEQQELEEQKAIIENRLAGLNAEAKRTLEVNRDQIVREAAELHRLIRQAAAELKKKRTRETVDAARSTLESLNRTLEGEAWAPPAVEPDAAGTLRPGDTVNLTEFGLKATVLSISPEKGEAEVQAGQTRITVGLGGIEKISGRPAERPIRQAAAASPVPKAVPTTLDLRGKRAEEVETAVDYYLNDAALTNLNEVVIIHGFGTGTVRQIVRDFLSGHPLVKGFRPGGRGEGGDGVTVVSL